MDSDYISHSEKYDEELLSEGMIANAKLLSNDKYEFDNIMMLFGDRLKIVPNGTSRISKKIKINCFNDRYVYRLLFKPLCYKGHKDDFRDSIFELSNITTALFSYNTSNREYIGLEQIINHGEKIESIGNGLNNMINSVYTLMASYTKYIGEYTSPNDIMYKDMRTNMEIDPAIYSVSLKSFNLARLLLVVSDNFPNISYNRIIITKKSPINTRYYNNCGDNIVLNDLLYAGKYGKAAKEYSETFDKYVGYQGAFDDLLRSYDNVFEDTIRGRNVDKSSVLKIIKLVYQYYGSKYLRMSINNSLDKKSLELYRKKVIDAFNSVIKQYHILLNQEDYISKETMEKEVEYSLYNDNMLYNISKVKESFEPHEKVPLDANHKANELKLKYRLRG